jgi:signal peptidase
MLDFLRYLLGALLLSLALISLGWVILWRSAGAQILSVESGSMAPALNKGDLLIDLKAQPQSVKGGDVISYRSLHNPGQLITHRVVRIDYGRRQFITKGDNLSQPDPVVPFSSLAGKTIKAVPKVGYLFDQLHKPLGLLAFVYLPALLISLGEVWLLNRDYAYLPYQLI